MINILLVLQEIVPFIKSLYPKKKSIFLHEFHYHNNDIQELNSCLKSGVISTYSTKTEIFEKKIAEYTGAKYVLALINGSTALFLSLKLLNTDSNCEVITQPFSYISSANSIKFSGADPIFIDVNLKTLGMCPESLIQWLKKNVKIKSGIPINNRTKKIIKACIPVHTLGHPAEIDKIIGICNEFKIPVIEDAAQSLGSFYQRKHTGTFGLMSILSFNGNKILSTGGGGALLTNNKELYKRAYFLSNNAKLKRRGQSFYKEVGYNFRMPGINAALGISQMERIEETLEKKRLLALKYSKFFEKFPINFIEEPVNTASNYWLNTIIFNTAKEKKDFISYSHSNNIFVSGAWRPLSDYPMYSHCQKTDISNSIELYKKMVFLPSSV